MIIEIGTALLLLAGLLCIGIAVNSFFYKKPLNKLLFMAVLTAITCAFFYLLHIFIISDFSYAIVFNNSFSAKPLIYKISGAWGNHEGSMLMWVLILFICSYFFAAAHPQDFTAAGVLGLHGLTLCSYLILASNPFELLEITPKQGVGLNPILQDIGLAIHPPILYVGYVSTTIIFAFAASAMHSGKIDSKFARALQPWVMLSWAFLTLGIGLGSWWAYRELGWGGWWFWDPVENVSLLPWLILTALLHANKILQNRNIMHFWVMLLCVLAFGFSLLGTFVVRSGLLTSVHSFASDPARGVFLLAIFVAFVGYGIYKISVFNIPKAKPIEFFSREGILLANNLVLFVATLSIAFATLYPNFLEALGKPIITIGAPYYNKTFVPLITPLLVLMVIGMFSGWGKAKLSRYKHSLSYIALLSVLGGAAAGLIGDLESALFVIYAALAFWILFGSISYFKEKQKIRSFNKNQLGAMTTSHIGIAIMVFAIALNYAYSEQTEKYVEIGEEVVVDGTKFKIETSKLYKYPNYFAARADISVTGEDGEKITMLHPEVRRYLSNGQTTAETAIYNGVLYDIYTLIASTNDKTQKIALKIYKNYGMVWLWLGILMVTAGGFIILFGRLTKKAKK